MKFFLAYKPKPLSWRYLLGPNFPIKKSKVKGNKIHQVMDYSQVITRSHTGTSVKSSDAKLIHKEFGPFVKGNDHVSLIGTNGPSTFISRSKVDFISFSNLVA